MQCFTVWIAMQFVHACCLSLYLQFQCPGRRSHRGGSASQVIDLLSWAHTCLWEGEGSLRSCRGFWLFLDRLIGRGERWRSKHHTETGSQVLGAWSPSLDEDLTLWYEWNGLVLFVPRHKRGLCFGVPSWDTLIHESPFLWDSIDLTMV